MVRNLIDRVWLVGPVLVYYGVSVWLVVIH